MSITFTVCWDHTRQLMCKGIMKKTKRPKEVGCKQNSHIYTTDVKWRRTSINILLILEPSCERDNNEISETFISKTEVINFQFSWTYRFVDRGWQLNLRKQQAAVNSNNGNIPLWVIKFLMRITINGTSVIVN